jgi:hypothetical protein
MLLPRPTNFCLFQEGEPLRSSRTPFIYFLYMFRWLSPTRPLPLPRNQITDRDVPAERRGRKNAEG